MPQILKIAPLFLVRDLEASVAYWSEKVGFVANELYGNPPNFAMPSRSGQTIMLAKLPAGVEAPLPHWRVVDKCNQAYIWVDDARALYDEVVARGANIDWTLYDTPWGTREFGIQDLDDHDIAFGQVL